MLRSLCLGLLFGLLSLPLLQPALAQRSPSADAITFTAPDGTQQDGIRCGVRDLDALEAAQTRLQVQRWLQRNERQQPGAPVDIPVAFHIVRHDNGTTADVSDAQIDAQMDVLNAAFAGTGFTFSLQSVERVNNTNWSRHFPGSSQERQMKQALAVDPARVLNFYTGNLGFGLLGYATFPFDYPEDSYMHGVVVLYSSLPGGSAAPYNEGDTGTHEIGHYLGAYHTFQGGCAAPGDEVDDTPAEASSASGCPVGRDTCPGQPGLDPITNFMDYTDDACMVEFSPGQSDRMNQLTALYKPTLYYGDGGTGDDLAITATPPSDPVVVGAGGGQFTYRLDVTNNGTAARTVDLWVNATGATVDKTQGPVSRTIAAGATLTLNVTQKVPGRIPSGEYTMTASVGTFPSAVDSDAFAVLKQDGAAKTQETTWDVLFETEDEALTVPVAFGLEQNYPNPFNPSTLIRFNLQDAGPVRLRVFNMLGQEVAVLVDDVRDAGSYEVRFDAAGLSAGTYLYRLETNVATQTRQLTLLK